MANLESQIAREREEEVARKKREEDEKKKAQAEAKYKADAPARKKVSELIKDDVWKQRTADLQKSMAIKQQQLQQTIVTPDKTLPSRLMCTLDWAPNTPGWQACMAKMQAKFNTPAPAVLAPKNPDQVREQREAVAKGQPPLPTTANAPAPTTLTKQQYDYLKANAAALQPEQRKVEIGLAAPAPTPDFAVCSTFANTDPEKRNCPPPPTAEQAEAAKKRQDAIAEAQRRAEAEKKARDEARAAEERARERKAEEEARARVYQVKEVDDTDCTVWLNIERQNWCGIRGHPGQRCEIITVTKTCEKRTALPDRCTEISRVREVVCR